MTWAVSRANHRFTLKAPKPNTKTTRKGPWLKPQAVPVRGKKTVGFVLDELAATKHAPNSAFFSHQIHTASLLELASRVLANRCQINQNKLLVLTAGQASWCSALRTLAYFDPTVAASHKRWILLLSQRHCVRISYYNILQSSLETCHPVQCRVNMRARDCATVWDCNCLQLIYLSVIRLILFEIYIRNFFSSQWN